MIEPIASSTPRPSSTDGASCRRTAAWGDTATPGRGSLYAVLDRLVVEGLVEPAGEEVVDGRLRRYYRLTGDGRSALAEEARRRASVSKEALRRLRLAGGVA